MPPRLRRRSSSSPLQRKAPTPRRLSLTWSSGRSGSHRGRNSGRRRGGPRQTTEEVLHGIEIDAFLQLDVEILLLEVKQRELMFIHELDDLANFFEVHRVAGLDFKQIQGRRGTGQAQPDGPIPLGDGKTAVANHAP